MALNVYWAQEPIGTTAYPEPTRLLEDLQEEKTTDSADPTFWRCPAVTGTISNIFVVRSPVTTGAVVTRDRDGKASVEQHGHDMNFRARHQQSVTDRDSLMMNTGGLMLFCKEEITAQWTSPYFSETQHLQFGALVPGAMNIGAWFRPLQFEFLLWKGVHNIQLMEGEPLAYMQFNTDKRVNLIPFQLTQEILNVSLECVTSSEVAPRQPLETRYEQFRETRRDRLLQSIKDNALLY